MLSLGLNQTLPIHIYEKYYFPPHFTLIVHNGFIGLNHSMQAEIP